ncbi:hypothetical protein BACI349Y_530004 [Bacillus sp. 349Y]|nr:hypothetical protein BACI349Y_530004 [Bacillus sp. 349Y]
MFPQIIRIAQTDLNLKNGKLADTSNYPQPHSFIPLILTYPHVNNNKRQVKLAGLSLIQRADAKRLSSFCCGLVKYRHG